MTSPRVLLLGGTATTSSGCAPAAVAAVAADVELDTSRTGQDVLVAAHRDDALPGAAQVDPRPDAPVDGLAARVCG